MTKCDGDGSDCHNDDDDDDGDDEGDDDDDDGNGDYWLFFSLKIRKLLLSNESTSR